MYSKKDVHTSPPPYILYLYCTFWAYGIHLIMWTGVATNQNAGLGECIMIVYNDKYGYVTYFDTFGRL